MRTIHIFIMFILMSIAAWAQDTNYPDRDISLKILNKKGRPVNKIFVQSLGTGKTGFTDHSGLFIFRDTSDKDTISLVLPKYGKIFIPVAGLDSIIVSVRSKNLSYLANDGQTVIIEKTNRTISSTILDVPELLRQKPCNSLLELLEGRVSGLIIDSRRTGDPNSVTTATMRGTTSREANSEPLVVMDGITLGTLSDANLTVNLLDIKTIEVLKNGAEWGVRGSNGVILINTK